MFAESWTRGVQHKLEGEGDWKWKHEEARIGEARRERQEESKKELIIDSEDDEQDPCELKIDELMKELE